MKIIIQLFCEFFKFGCFTFGGGWSIIAQMQKLYVEKKKYITSEELLDLTSVGRSLPGTMIGNVAMLFGYHMAGFMGGIACVIGMVIPPMAVLVLITFFYSNIQDNTWVMSAMLGVRAAIVPTIASAIIGMTKGAFKYPPCYLVMIMAFGLYVIADMSCVWIIVIGAVCGMLISELYERREWKKK